ncbi:RloB family protein [Micromonospora sp. NPDC050417]|uniref:RloB family protein n=1 Tax=Micromonospora sp. NPDC050417 TaxID=3364280 RepID=UPI0037AF1D12
MVHGVGGRSLERRRGTRSERSRILVVTEGKVTEPQYFRGLAQYVKATGVDIRALDIVGLGRDPLRIVLEAVRLRKEGQNRDLGNDGYDSAWCVIDVDRHDTLSNAISLARREKISIAITNPCFELWILWHFKDRTVNIQSSELRRLLRPYGCADKKLPRDFAYVNYRDAVRRASVQANTVEDVQAIPMNPGTGVHVLVSALIPG